jgi:hypothetical protein
MNGNKTREHIFWFRSWPLGGDGFDIVDGPRFELVLVKLHISIKNN